MNKKIILALMIGAMSSQTDVVFAMKKNQQHTDGINGGLLAIMPAIQGITTMSPLGKEIDFSRPLSDKERADILNFKMQNAVSLEKIVSQLPSKNLPQYTDHQITALKNEFTNIKSEFHREGVNGMFLQYCDIFIMGRPFLTTLSRDCRQEKLLEFLKSTLPHAIDKNNNSIIKVFLINKAIENKDSDFIKKVSVILSSAFKCNAFQEIKQITDKENYKLSIARLIEKESISSILYDALRDLIEQLSN